MEAPGLALPAPFNLYNRTSAFSNTHPGQYHTELRAAALVSMYITHMLIGQLWVT